MFCCQAAQKAHQTDDNVLQMVSAYSIRRYVMVFKTARMTAMRSTAVSLPEWFIPADFSLNLYVTVVMTKVVPTLLKPGNVPCAAPYPPLIRF